MESVKWDYLEQRCCLDQLGQIYKELAKEFDKKQISQILLGFINGLSVEQVESYAKTDFSSDKMWIIRKCFEELDIEQVELCVKAEFDKSQMHQIFMSFTENELSVEEVEAYAFPECSAEEMRVFRQNIRECGLSVEQIKKYAHSGFNFYQLELIFAGYKSGLSEKQIEVYARPEFPGSLMKELLKQF